ncbi:hypothetical protein AG1IA_06133 [Rhizoctonia solani AG-1 IA]|uniref:Uncharacterized protein n=1 Tax=Thanatephorus cucumeris (strain AG1-IA) TaxID=983506 RepID=L8WST4_THACA|nr:hypothetical protein AG1IA_06133 [Rhizoctonia solani AG-1 IA]
MNRVCYPYDVARENSDFNLVLGSTLTDRRELKLDQWVSRSPGNYLDLSKFLGCILRCSVNHRRSVPSGSSALATMESMCGKFPLANRPKLTRRKRKNLSLTPGASITMPDRPRRGGSSPTTEPANIAPWLTKDNPSSPTTDEALPITPHSDMSSTFSASPPLSARPLQSPVFGRRNAISAGPRGAQIGFLPEGRSYSPAGGPLVPTSTWPQMTGGPSHFPAMSFDGLAHTQSDGALSTHSRVLDQRIGAEYNQPNLGLPQNILPYDISQSSSYSTTFMRPVVPGQSCQLFDQPSGDRTEPSLPTQTFIWQDFTSNHPPINGAENHRITNSNFDPELPNAMLPPNIVTTGYGGSYVNVNSPNPEFSSSRLSTESMATFMAGPDTESPSQGISMGPYQVPTPSSHENVANKGSPKPRWACRHDNSEVARSSSKPRGKINDRARRLSLSNQPRCTKVKGAKQNNASTSI